MQNTLEFEFARVGNRNEWVPACGGHEQPFLTRNGTRLLYVFNPALHQHAYMNCDTDILITDQQAFEMLA